MSPDQVMKKRFGIFIHQSQKDMVPFQGSDTREFWQSAEDRNSNTANLYAHLGLPNMQQWKHLYGITTDFLKSEFVLVNKMN